MFSEGGKSELRAGFSAGCFDNARFLMDVAPNTSLASIQALARNPQCPQAARSG
jgi:hypothetical protein